MKIAIYGATGNVGSRIVTEAVARGQDVTAFSRRGGGEVAGVPVSAGDAADAASVAAVADDHDVIVSALGPARDGSDPRGYLGVLQNLIDNAGDARLFVVGGAGSLLATPDQRLVDLPEFPDAYKPEALVHADALELLRGAGDELDWVYLSPAPEIGPGARTGVYQAGLDSPVGNSVTFEDYAVAAVDELDQPKHRRRRFTVAN